MASPQDPGAERFAPPEGENALLPGTGAEEGKGAAVPSLPGYLAARKELLAIEAREAAEHARSKGTQAGALAFGLFFFWALLLCAAVSFLGKWAAELWGDRGIGWEAVAAALALLHLLVGLVALARLRRKPPGGKLFKHTLSELEKDRQWLQKRKGNKES